MSQPRLTPALQQSIVAYARAGGFPHVAAEAASVGLPTFRDWMARGESQRPARRYRDFARAVRQAHAQARLGAEIAVRDGKPLDWLRAGPGRESPDRPGWTANARPRLADRPDNTLTDPAVQGLFTRLLAAFHADPDTRARLADWFHAESAHCRPFVS